MFLSSIKKGTPFFESFFGLKVVAKNFIFKDEKEDIQTMES